MSKAQHTPGPWHVAETVVHGPHIRDVNGFCVATSIAPANSRADYIDAEANARLIAAAPDLLAALEKCKQWHLGDMWRKGTPQQREAWEKHISMINAAIAKAKGE